MKSLLIALSIGLLSALVMPITALAEEAESRKIDAEHVRVFMADSEIAQAKFNKGCQSAISNQDFCTCLFRSMPALITWRRDDPWLHYIETMDNGGLLTADAEEVRSSGNDPRSVYLKAAEARDSCSAQHVGAD